MNTKIYIDESGNTGSISVKGITQQPLFALGAIQISDELLCELIKIEDKFRNNKKIQQAEIKSSNTYDNQIDFTVEILTTLISNKVPMWFEVTNKKYYIICNLVTFTLLQAWVTRDLDKDKRELMNSLVNYIDKNILTEELNPYLIACQFPTRDNLLRFLHYFTRIIKNLQKAEERDAILLATELLIPEVMDENDPFETKHYFPLPDFTKKGNILTLLPYVQSFSNIFARINNWCKSNCVSNVEIIHDEQKQFDEIIKDYHDFCETGIKPSWINLELSTTADYIFDKSYNLSFADSKSIKTLQYADIVVGFICRAINQSFSQTISSDYSVILKNLLSLPIQVSTGSNLVMSRTDFEKIMVFRV